MIDALTSLAFSIYSCRGTYALLLGSGVSRSAEILTGWEVTLDLIRRVATIHNETCEPNPEMWYSEKFGEPPSYSVLLEQLAKTSAERTAVLASYFEPSQADRENGHKVFTKAHHQIAKLVAKSYIRVIITTNFDRLMEQALEAEGIVPTVISTVDAIKGAMPLQHAACTVVKVHGDYRDTRFKNTEEELATYPPELDRLLDRIFDEYGMLVCGWSATWDPALRKAFTRSPNHRFTTAWASIGQSSTTALDLIKFRLATCIDITSADDFFCDLGNKIEALERFNAPHPLSVDLAVTSTKRLLSKPEFRIELSDLVRTEVEKQFAILDRDKYLNATTGTLEEYSDALVRIEQSLAVLVSILTTGINVGERQYSKLWLGAVLRMLDLCSGKKGAGLAGIRRYPASLLFYAAGVSACVVDDYKLLRLLFTNTSTVEGDSRDFRTPLVAQLLALKALSEQNLNALTPIQKYVAASEHVLESLRNYFRLTVPNDTYFEEVFDRFEYFLALSFVKAKSGSNPDWAPMGRFAYRSRFVNQDISAILREEHANEGTNWSPIACGLFNDFADYQECEGVVQRWIQRCRYY